MNKMPNFAQRGVAGLLAGLLSTVVFSGIFISSLGVNLTDRNNVQGWLKRPGVHAELSKVLTKQLVTDNPAENTGQKQIAALSEKLLTYENYSRNIDNVSNSIYDWLDGTKPTPAFQIQLAASPAELRKTVVDTVVAEVSKLPDCTPDQSEQTDPLSATCKPPGFSTAMVEEELNKASDGEMQKLLNTGAITQDNFQLDQGLRSQYELFQRAPIIFLVTGLILSLLITLTLFNIPMALRRIGMSVALPSTVMAVVAIALLLLSNTLADQAGNQAATDNAAAGSLLRAILPPILKSINTTTLLYAVGTLVIGGLLILGSKFIEKKQQSNPVIAAGKTK